MIYRSNLLAPDLSPHFRLKQPPLQMLGHDVPSDPDFIPACGFLTHDEAAILFNIAKAFPKRWVDIGARLGWTAAHLAEAAEAVHAVEPELMNNAHFERLLENLQLANNRKINLHAVTSEAFFSRPGPPVEIDAAMIDGCHDAPEPTFDAIRAIGAGARVLVWHDFQGKPVRDAVNWVVSNCNWRARVYWTPNLMAVAWRKGSGFVPPDHVRDPAIDWSGYERIVAADFDCARCS